MKGLSDHHTVLATYDRGTLIELYRQHFLSAA